MRQVGLSPRVRGNLPSAFGRDGVPRSIPACAGEPCSRPAPGSRRWVYPRVCGGTAGQFGVRRAGFGLSPRVRGNLVLVLFLQGHQGSIPACAEEPAGVIVGHGGGRVYPRVCGGTVHRVQEIGVGPGLSPRVRGNQPSTPTWNRKGGSIPACAGEPPQSPAARSTPGVYPRVCGGTPAGPPPHIAGLGLSPRVRGNRHHPRLPAAGEWSIPACAGEPLAEGVHSEPPTVYPRVCGGTYKPNIINTPDWGLSPRVRGNLKITYAPIVSEGSIPACAGEPLAFALIGGLFGVYPRVCGGTHLALGAYLGIQVYPRVCGGTRIQGRMAYPLAGLSPRVRGNPKASQMPAQAARSIPACAGEPPAKVGRCPCRSVYPRVCGGTLPTWSGNEYMGGLSPRVRGNPDGADLLPDDEGSIPACAGEPWRHPARTSPGGVYPRVCGGTTVMTVQLRCARGLSPRVRGNLSIDELGSDTKGSIPACAGEPIAARERGISAGVYPRVCGGTTTPPFTR